MAKERTFKLDIFQLLGSIDNPRSGDVYDNLSDDEKKGFAPLVVMRWMTGTSDERQVMLLNEFVNPYVFPLGKHPQLLMQSLQVASSKKSKRYGWLGVKGGKKSTLANAVIAEYFDYSTREVALLNPRPSSQEILQMAEELGWQKDEGAKLKKELE
jgi:hypothetical protein